MQEHGGGAAVAEALGCPHSDLVVDGSGQDASRWLVIDPDGQKYREALLKIATAPPGVVWVPNEKLREPDPEPFELYDNPDEYPWCDIDIWEVWQGNPTGFRAIRVVETGELDGDMSRYVAVEDRLLRDWLIDPARREYSRLREVACLYGSETYDPNLFGKYGPELFDDRRNGVIEKACELLQRVGGFGWLLDRLECMGTTDPYVALALRPHIGRHFGQQSYDALRWEFEAHRGELLHPDDLPLADIRYKPVEASS